MNNTYPIEYTGDEVLKLLQKIDELTKSMGLEIIDSPDKATKPGIYAIEVEAIVSQSKYRQILLVSDYIEAAMGDYTLFQTLIDAEHESIKTRKYIDNVWTAWETIGDIDLSEYYTKSQIDSKLSSVYKYKGTVQVALLLPTETKNVGDVYNVYCGITSTPEHIIKSQTLYSITNDGNNSVVNITGLSSVLAPVGAYIAITVEMPNNFGGGTLSAVAKVKSLSANNLTIEHIRNDNDPVIKELFDIGCFGSNWGIIQAALTQTSPLTVRQITTSTSTVRSIDGMNYAWTGTAWDNLGGYMDISAKAEKSDTLSGYGITDAYTKTEIDSKIASVYKYKGSKRTFSELPPSAACVAGDVWNVESEVSRNFYGVKVVSVYAYGMGFDGEGGEMALTDVSAFTVGKTYQVCTEGKKILGTMTPTGISGNTLTFTYLTNSDYYGVFCDIAETKAPDYWNTWMEGTAVNINETYYFYSADFASTPPGTDKITKIINEGGTNFAWTGTAWDALGGTVDFSDYYTRAQVDGKIAAAIESALNTEV